MKLHMICIAAVAVSFAMSAGFADDGVTLVGWGVDHKNLDSFMADAEAVGFDMLITGSTDPATLARTVEVADRHNIKIFSYISPMGHMRKLWTERYPERPVPWQVMNEGEQAACAFIAAGENKYIIPYQFGGEPVMTNEVLYTRVICFNNPEARELAKPLIDRIVSVPGLEGLGFDGFGYQNYHRCHCERCQGLLDEYKAAHPDMPEDEAEVACFRDALVGCINELADHARSQRPDIKTSIHIWPVFAPEPLYGNRLDVDFCGQTAAWYNLWPKEKIADYSQRISGEAREYFARQEGVGMIGYYDRPGQFPVKDAARVDMELGTMIENGCRRIQVCSSLHVIRNAEIAAVFSKYFR